MPSFEVICFPSGPLETNAYLVACLTTQKAAVIDPAAGSYAPFMQKIEEKKWHVEKILLTHSHWDHFVDAKKVQDTTRAPLYVHDLDRDNVEYPGSDGLFLPLSIDPPKVDEVLNEKDVVSIGNLSFQVLHTPGHAKGAVCFYEEKEKILFSGDTLFRGSMGKISLATAEPEKMWTSLQRLSRLPPDTKVFPGHGPSTTIGRESWMEQAKKIFGG